MSDSEVWSTSPRVPGKDGRYLVSLYRYGNIGHEVDEVNVIIMRVNNGHWVYPRHIPEWINDALTQEVLAWTYLPEPYKGGEQNG